MPHSIVNVPVSSGQEENLHVGLLGTGCEVGGKEEEEADSCAGALSTGRPLMFGKCRVCKETDNDYSKMYYLNYFFYYLDYLCHGQYDWSCLSCP